MALWKMRSSGQEQNGEMNEKEEPELKELPCEEGSLLANKDVKMSEVYSAVLSVDVSPCCQLDVIVKTYINIMNSVFADQFLDGDVLWRFLGAKSDG
jgi:hypothetical protein